MRNPSGSFVEGVVLLMESSKAPARTLSRHKLRKHAFVCMYVCVSFSFSLFFYYPLLITMSVPTAELLPPIKRGAARIVFRWRRSERARFSGAAENQSTMTAASYQSERFLHASGTPCRCCTGRAHDGLHPSIHPIKLRDGVHRPIKNHSATHPSIRPSN